MAMDHLLCAKNSNEGNREFTALPQESELTVATRSPGRKGIGFGIGVQIDVVMTDRVGINLDAGGKGALEQIHQELVLGKIQHRVGRQFDAVFVRVDEAAA